VAHLTVPSDALGAKRVLAFARQHQPGRRVWAIEGTGYGSGLTTYLLAQGEWVVEIDRPARGAARAHRVTALVLDGVRASRRCRHPALHVLADAVDSMK